MELNYKFKVKTSEVTSAFKEADSPSTADLYLRKKHKWFDYKIDFNTNSDFILDSVLFEKKVLNNKIIFKVNTLNIKLSDVVINNEVYFYKLVFNENLTHTLETIHKDLNLVNVVEKSGEFYTNTPLCNYNSDLDFYYTKNVLEVSDFKCIFRKDCIEIETGLGVFLELKEFVIEPSIINQYSFYTPSFYLKSSSGKSIHCVESDIKIFESTVEDVSPGYLKYKLESTPEVALAKNFNTLLIKSDNLNSLFRMSTHCFVMAENVQYYTVTPDGSIIKSSKEDYIFKISKEVDLNYIDIIPNTYKHLDNSVKDIRSNFINSYNEVDETINNFGFTYNKITKEVPEFNYIKDIKFSMFEVIKNPKLKLKSLKEDGTNFRVLTETLIDTRNIIEFDKVKYFKSE